jgi:hypothetical protein
LNDDVVTNPAVLPVLTVILNGVPLPLVKVITLLLTDAVIKALEADVLRLVIDVVTLLVKFNMLELKLLVLPV